jgi:hypothetical protein
MWWDIPTVFHLSSEVQDLAGETNLMPAKDLTGRKVNLAAVYYRRREFCDRSGMLRPASSGNHVGSGDRRFPDQLVFLREGEVKRWRGKSILIHRAPAGET